MTPQDIFDQGKEIFEQAMELPGDQRHAHAEAVCAGRPELLAEVSRRLAAASSAADAAPTLKWEDNNPGIPTHIGRYEIEARIGEGGMGWVYRARDPVLLRSVAIKTIKIGGSLGFATNRDSLLREMRVGASLADIPGIVTFHDAGVDDAGGIAYIAMALVDGPSLQKVMVPDRPIEQRFALDVLSQIATALDQAHAKGVVHCDVKPANILLHNGNIVRITDFGISRFRAPGASRETGPIQGLGTPHYMSPEQITLSKPVDRRSDQYSLGVVAFQMLTGRLPFEGPEGTLAQLIVLGQRPAASAILPQLPVAVDGPLKRSLAIDPEMRFDTCAAFVEMLSKALRPPVQRMETVQEQQKTVAPVPTQKLDSRFAVPGLPSRPVTLIKEPRRSRGVWAWAALAVAGILAAGAAVLRLGPSAIAPSPVVKPAPPPPSKPLAKLTVEPARIGAGEAATLRWDVSDANFVVIDQGIGKVAASGSLNIRPAATTEYTLNATGRGGDEVARVSLEVELPPGKDSTTPKTLPKIDRTKVEDTKSAPPPPGPKPDAELLLRTGMAQTEHHEYGAARESYSKAAQAGNAKAMFLLGVMYEQGLGGSQDDAAALRSFEQAASLGDARAMLNVGHMYYYGRGGAKKSQTEAANWYAKAVQVGDADGAYRLGMMYEAGAGVPRDLTQARELYIKSGKPEALSRLARLPSTRSESATPAKPLDEPLTFSSIIPARIKENQAIQYKLSGSGFSRESQVRLGVASVIGSKKGLSDNRPVEVEPGGHWMKIYIYLPRGESSGSVELTVRNPDGNSVRSLVQTEP